MTRSHPDPARLSGYLDGDLAAAERAALEGHLAACGACAATLAELAAVRDRARALPPLAPPAALWAAIEARLGAAVVDLGAERAKRARRWSFSTPQLAAAAAALIVVSAAGAWLMGRNAAIPVATSPVAITAPDTAAPVPGAGPAAPAPLAAAADAVAPRRESAPSRGAGGMPPRHELGGALTARVADFGVERYDSAIAELEQVLADNRTRLNPATVEVVEANLALIDRAIADARRALAADPASRYLNDHLAETMKRKVDLLRRVTSAIQS